MVSFTGSTVAGRRILAQAAPTVKRVSLELGGKSAQIYLPDAVHRAAGGAAVVVASTAGQACVAATRMLVPQDRKDEVLQAVSEVYKSIKVGPPTDESAMMGPVANYFYTKSENIFVTFRRRRTRASGVRPAGCNLSLIHI